MAISYRGHEISNVVISTSMGHDGNGLFPYNFFSVAHGRIIMIAKETDTTSLTKSATRFSRLGNFRPKNPFTWRKYVKKIPGSVTGMWNNYALTNDGVEIIAPRIREARFQGLRPIPNYYPEFDKGEEIAIQEAIDSMDTYWYILDDLFWACELSYSCPNSGEVIEKNIGSAARCTREIKKIYPWLFVIVKGSIVHPQEFWEEQERAGADCFHGINSVPIDLAFLPGQNPLDSVKGGAVSGGPVKEMAFSYNKKMGIRTKLPKIFGCGVETVDDVRKYQEIGGDAVSICSVVIRDPNETEKILRTFNS